MLPPVKGKLQLPYPAQNLAVPMQVSRDLSLLRVGVLLLCLRYGWRVDSIVHELHDSTSARQGKISFSGARLTVISTLGRVVPATLCGEPNCHGCCDL